MYICYCVIPLPLARVATRLPENPEGQEGFEKVSVYVPLACPLLVVTFTYIVNADGVTRGCVAVPEAVNETEAPEIVAEPLVKEPVANAP